MPNLLGRARVEQRPTSRLPLRAAGLALLSGVRSTAGPAFVVRAARRGSLPGLRGTVFERLGSRRVANALLLAMVGEMVADKTPLVPPRTAPGPLLGRASAGALTGAVLFAAGGRRSTVGAVLGALSAAAGAFAGERLRSRAGRTALPDLVPALLEDAVVLWAGTRLSRNS